MQSLNLGTIEVDTTHGREGYQIISDKGPFISSMSSQILTVRTSFRSKPEL
jgi:hypothetical protein